jgi:peptidoglycan/xylan/chitin deacetylase (PgdA/CDA1 family)
MEKEKMRKLSFHFMIYRYEAMLAIIILVLTGSIAVSSRDNQSPPLPEPPASYKIAITFDDGPRPYYTEQLLNMLRANNVRATFFVVGNQIKTYPGLLRLISGAGHEVEVHTLTHRNLTFLSVSEIRNELFNTAELIRGISGQRSVYFRPPGGQYNAKVVKVAESLNMSMVLWTVFPKDHEEDDQSVIIKRVLAQATDGGVILFHLGREPTYEALQAVIKVLRDRGYRFVTIS